MPLNETQLRFLEKYVNTRGNQYQALDELGLDLAHLISWRDNKDFDKQFRLTTNKLVAHLRQESFVLATVKVNESIKNGVIHETYTQEHTVNQQSGNTYKAKKTVKNLGVPVPYLKLALAESALTKAIQTLANEGVLPLPIAKQILLKAETITNELMDSFEVKEDVTVSEEKIVAYIKSAVLEASKD